MTMHLMGPYMTTTRYNNSKKKSKKTQSQIQAEQAHEKYLRKMGVHPDQLEAKKNKSVKCYGSTSVSKTESRGSTPCTDAKYKVEQCCGPVAFYYVKQILHSVGVRCVRPKDMRLTGCQIWAICYKV